MKNTTNLLLKKKIAKKCNDCGKKINMILDQNGKYSSVISVTDCESLILIKFNRNAFISSIKLIYILEKILNK
jgi:hypothetical protein